MVKSRDAAAKLRDANPGSAAHSLCALRKSLNFSVPPCPPWRNEEDNITSLSGSWEDSMSVTHVMGLDRGLVHRRHHVSVQ